MLLRHAIAGLILLTGLNTAEPASPAGLPVSHRIIAQDRGHIAIVNAKGAVEWEVPCAFTSHDIAVLPNGNLLLHTGPATIVEMTPEKKVVWQYDSRPAEG